MQNQSIEFKLFGGFFYKTSGEDEWKNVNEVLPGVSGKKACLFLKYLVINHKRIMPATELMDTFWPEGVSNDPENALQQMLFKVRKLLKGMFPEIQNPIISHSKQYSWNPELAIRLDLEQFDEILAKAKSGDSVNVDELVDAINLYGTGVQTVGEQDWLEAIYVYYHTIYMDIARMVMEPLVLKSEWVKIIEICQKVCDLEPCADEFVSHMMQALIMMGNQQNVIKCYKSFRDKLKTEFDVEPSPEVEAMYQLALSSDTQSSDAQDILKILEVNDAGGAFFCSFNVFSHLVMMERRHAERSKQPSTLLVIGVDELQLSSTTEIHRLEKILHSGLRRCDAVTRLNASSFIVLLSGTGTESVDIVSSRIKKAFFTEFSQSSAQFLFKTVPLPEL